MIAVGVLGALTAVLTATVPAGARSRPPVNVKLVGSLTIAWQGDQARGCAAEGLCGVSGSIQMIPTGDSSSSPGPPPIDFNDENSAVRVTESSPSGATEATCADLVPVDFDLGFRHQGAGDLVAVVEQENSLQLPSAGRCAGPTVADLSALELPARRLGSHGYDLSGQTTFGAGPFTVTAISTVRAVFTRGTSGIGGIGGISTATAVGHSTPPSRLRTVLEEHAEIDYRIEGLAGALTTTFAGLPPPLCDPLGACGTTGELTESFTTSGVLTFFGSRLVKHRAGSRAALAALRSGRLEVYDSFDGIPIEETVTETLAAPNGTACFDRVTEGPLSAVPNGAGRHAVELKLAGGAGPQYFGPGGIDALRTRCPGPSAADVLGTSPLATATLPVSALGAHRLALTFQSGGSFTGSAYTGQRGGSIVLTLVFEHASGGTIRFPRAPILPPP